ncbi:MAG: glycosyltransferase family 2 protein [Polyangiaceae bacterium]
MLQGARIAVVVPAFAEERLLPRTLAGVPHWVDIVVVVDDASPDATAARARDAGDPRVVLIRHPENRGVGASIATGYVQARELGADVVAVMAGDAQMDPADLESLVAPIVSGQADYVKGNRFVHARAKQMPLLRRWGSRALSALTRELIGLEVDDTQCGYTAISSHAIGSLPSRSSGRASATPDLLGMLAAARLRVAEVPVRPVYADEDSGLRPWHLISIGGVIVRRALKNRRATTPDASAAPATSLDALAPLSDALRE